MSEYQYYEFQTVDKPLTVKQQQEVEKLSTRAEITSTHFTNEYHFGDFKHDPIQVLAKYYDAFYYTANWGTHRLAFRFPAGLVDVEAFRAYVVDNHVTFSEQKDHVILDIDYYEDGGEMEYDEDEPDLDDLLPLRKALLDGDLRPLYIAWLATSRLDVDEEEEEEKLIEPPVPLGMSTLSKMPKPLKALATFLQLDAKLLSAAVKKAPTGEAPAGPSREELAAWVAAQPVERKNAWLVSLFEEEEPSPRGEAMREFRLHWKTKQTKPEAAKPQPQRETQQAKAKSPQRQQEAPASGEDQEKGIWEKIDSALETKRAKEYAQVVEWLADLRKVAARERREEEILARIRKLRQTHAHKAAFLRRLDEAGLQ